MIQLWIEQESHRFLIDLELNYEFETSPKHKIYVMQFKSITRLPVNHT